MKLRTEDFTKRIQEILVRVPLPVRCTVQQEEGRNIMGDPVPGEDEVPEPPEGWHEEHKSDVPDDELEGLDD
jgi:hypothetical protein